MDANNVIGDILRNATGRRASGRELLVSEKKSILEPKAAATLKEQWQSAGRDHAKVVMMLSEADGSNPHFVTGWDGKDTFVCYTETGLAHVNYRNLEKMKVESRWNPKTRLIDVRAHQLTENELSGPEVDMIVDKIKKTLKKSSKKRRKGRLRNMEKFFNFAVVENTDTVNEFEKVKEKDDRIPAEPKEPSTQKLPKDAKAKQTHRESFDWDHLDASGRPVRRGLRHPMMNENSCDPQLDKREHVRMDGEGKGNSGSATPGGNKTDPQQKLRQLVRMNRESKRYLESNGTEPQLDKRELVSMNKEGGGGCAATPGGNKTDPQDNAREQVDVRHEDKAMGAKDGSDKSDDCDHMTYAGEKVKDPEKSARPKITVRHEAMGSKKAQNLFGPQAGSKAPKDGKLVLMIMMGKAKGKGKAPKRQMAESVNTCTGCGKSFTVGNTPPWKPLSGLPSKCPSCEAKRAQSGGKLTIKKVELGKKSPPKDTFESRYARSGLNLIESRRTSSRTLANIERMRIRAGRR